MDSILVSGTSALIGAVSALGVNWFQVVRKEAEEIQDWYEKIYIFEGVDPVILALSQLSYFYANSRYKILMPASEMGPPLEAVERVQTLLNFLTGPHRTRLLREGLFLPLLPPAGTGHP